MSNTTDNVRSIHVAATDQFVRRCWLVFKELRPHLESEDEFVVRWQRQANEGYRIVFAEEDGIVQAAAGYRFLHTMAWGHILYIDDLVALSSAHRRGFGTLLLRHLQNEAREADCDAVHLDIGYQRHLAHRAYLKNGFHIDCHHMAWRVRRE